MNKVFNINLGGYAFTIDDNAYQHLSGYLKTIHNHFQDSEGYEEITSDIETRIAELFQESLGNHPIVTFKMVKEAITIMGTPEEFGATPIDDFQEEPVHKSSTRKEGKQQYKTGKRLMRDPEDQVIGGVCSGVAAYFGIADPLWVRLGFGLFVMSGGVGVPAYIILWAVLKEAKTSSDRLAMKGADINISNMAKVVEEEVTNFGDKISEMAGEWDGTGKKKNFTGQAEFKQNVKEGISFFGKGIRMAIELLSTIIKPIIFIVGFALIIAFAALWLASIIGFFLGFPFLQFVFPQQPLLGGLLIFNIAVFIGIPLLSLIFLASKLVFKTKFNVRWRGGLLAFFIINAISFFGIGSYLVSQFTSEADAHESSQRFSVEDEVFKINFTENPYENSLVQIGPGGMLKLEGEELAIENIRLVIEKSEDEDFVLIQETNSRGNGLREAKILAKKIEHSVSRTNNQLDIKPYFLLSEGEKWRAQSVNLILKVPEGKSIQFKNLDRMNWTKIDYIDNNDGNHHFYWAKDEATYKMDKDGLLGEGLHNDRINKDDYNFGDKYQGFSRIHVDGQIKIEITQGDKFSTKLTGRDQYLRKVEVEQFNDVLKVSTDLKRTSAPVRLYVTLPSLTEVDFEDTDDAKLTGFKEPTMTIRNESRSEIKAYVDVDDLLIKLEGRNELDIRGKGKKMKIYLGNAASLDAERFAVDIADIKADDRSKASLAVADTLRQRLSGNSRVKVDGEPVVLEE
ncbi:MAG: DUF2807 domain-containing protein [Saprospiraceae bacterium]